MSRAACKSSLGSIELGRLIDGLLFGVYPSSSYESTICLAYFYNSSKICSKLEVIFKCKLRVDFKSDWKVFLRLIFSFGRFLKVSFWQYLAEKSNLV